MAKALNESELDRITDAGHDDWYRGRGITRRLGHRRRPRDDDVRFETNELGGKREAVHVTVRESRFDRDGSALHPPQREQALSKRFNEWIRRAGPTVEHGHPVCRAELLRRCVKRRGESRCETRHECAAVHRGRDAIAR
jgi:hypothetical protein